MMVWFCRKCGCMMLDKENRCPSDGSKKNREDK